MWSYSEGTVCLLLITMKASLFNRQKNIPRSYIVGTESCIKHCVCVCVGGGGAHLPRKVKGQLCQTTVYEWW